MPTSSAAIPYYSSSLYILGIYALRVTLILSQSRAFKLFAASAERKCIFEIEKSMNPEVFACFSRFFHFLNFGRFWDGLTVNFDVWAQFAARGWLQIALGRNFTCIQIFFSYSVHVPTRLCTQLPQKSIEWRRNQDRTLDLYLMYSGKSLEVKRIVKVSSNFNFRAIFYKFII